VATVGTIIGTLGSPWRATVTPWGAVAPADGSSPLDWWVAADDRWHAPASEPSRRQYRMLGAPVMETVVGVPGGDIVHRAYAVADGGAAAIVELENRSSLPVAVAFSRPDALTGRPLAPLPPDAPVGAAVAVPLAHRATVRVGLARAPTASTPSADQVARGWVAQTETGARFLVPDDGLARAVVAARADALLAGAAADPIDLVLTARERVRLGEAAEPWVADVAGAAVTIAKGARRQPTWAAPAALDAAADVLARAGETTAATDVLAMAARLPPGAPVPPDAPGGVRVLAWLERRLLRPANGGIDLLPGFPPDWAGQGVEVYGASAAGVTVGFALRWHGDRPALLWDLSAPVPLTCGGLDPAWSAVAARGEALLARYRG
jgi:hypothetical protein